MSPLKKSKEAQLRNI